MDANLSEPANSAQTQTEYCRFAFWRLKPQVCGLYFWMFLVLREEFAFLFQLRPFQEMTLLDRRRRRGAVLSLKKKRKKRISPAPEKKLQELLGSTPDILGSTPFFL